MVVIIINRVLIVLVGWPRYHWTRWIVATFPFFVYLVKKAIVFLVVEVIMITMLLDVSSNVNVV